MNAFFALFALGAFAQLVKGKFRADELVFPSGRTERDILHRRRRKLARSDRARRHLRRRLVRDATLVVSERRRQRLVQALDADGHVIEPNIRQQCHSRRRRVDVPAREFIEHAVQKPSVELEVRARLRYHHRRAFAPRARLVPRLRVRPSSRRQPLEHHRRRHARALLDLHVRHRRHVRRHAHARDLPRAFVLVPVRRRRSRPRPKLHPRPRVVSRHPSRVRVVHRFHESLQRAPRRVARAEPQRSERVDLPTRIGESRAMRRRARERVARARREVRALVAVDRGAVHAPARVEDDAEGVVVVVVARHRDAAAAALRDDASDASHAPRTRARLGRASHVRARRARRVGASRASRARRAPRSTWRRRRARSVSRRARRDASDAATARARRRRRERRGRARATRRRARGRRARRAGAEEGRDEAGTFNACWRTRTPRRRR